MKILRTITLALFLAASLCGAASPSLQATAAKARRFFDNHEWANASALYTIMLHERPADRDLYGRAIVAASILNDSVRSQQLLRQALQYDMPLDSVMADVKMYSFIAGEPHLYENFLKRSAADNPWMKRAIQAQLLKYYTFRSDGPMMEKYALEMLKGAPDNETFLLTLAQAYMIQGMADKAVDTWQKVVDSHPDNFDAIVSLANFYSLYGAPDRALPLYTRAYDLHPTPWVAHTIERLTPRP